MAFQQAKNKDFTLKAYQGDAKTLLAFNLTKPSTKNLAGFTIQCQPKGQQAYYLLNSLRFETPGDHSQDAAEPANSSLNAPIHKFRWLHVPGSAHQGTQPFMGPYTYSVTPRYFDDQHSLQPLDASKTVSVNGDVVPFEKKGVKVGFTRGFTQSQAFVHHFGLKALIRPKDHVLQFDTAQESGHNAAGEKYTFEDEYQWLGFTARANIFAVLNQVLKDKKLGLKMFAYDLNEPDVIDILLKLAKQGRVQVILDNATLHHSTAPKKPAAKGSKKKAKGPTPEDQFQKLFEKAAGKKKLLLRGKFGRFAHDKVLIVSQQGKAQIVLSGSTNFSVTGLYVNSNHVLVFNDAKVADTYSKVFDAAWNDGVAKGPFAKSPFANQTYSFSSKNVPPTDITFSPHNETEAEKILDALSGRVVAEGKAKGGSVLFAVMELATGSGPVFPTLNKLHSNESIFSYGISDSPQGICLYRPGQKQGVLVTGKPTKTILPPPFDQVPSVGIGHQVHHKFVVCGFNGTKPVVYCGSSNLALMGETVNGDNLLAIHDADIATVFALEALALVDHFDFLDRCAAKGKPAAKKTKKPLKHLASSKLQQAVTAGWFLSTNDKWAGPYFDPKDLHCVDRQLFG